MKKKFDWWVLVLTILFSIAGCIFCFMIYERTAEDTWGRMIWTGFFFTVPLVGSLLGSFLAEGIQRRRFKIIRRSTRLLSLFLSVLIGMTVGAGGQALYMISPFEEKKGVDMVLLLDGSGSMEGKKENCDKAAEELIKQMDENCRVQVVSFAAMVLGNTELLPVDETGKNTLIEFINHVDVIGGTEFGQPLSFALNTLTQTSEKDRVKAVIMLSDGEGLLPDTLKNDYIKEGITLYTIRIDSGTEENEDTKKLIRMAEKTGGFDTLIKVDENGQADTGLLIEAFTAVFSEAKGIGMGQQMIVFGETNGLLILRFFIRTLVFAVYAVLVGVIYYRKLNKEQIVGNLMAGILLSILVTIFGQIGLDSPILSCVLFGILVFSAYTTYDYDKEVDEYV